MTNALEAVSLCIVQMCILDGGIVWPSEDLSIYVSVDSFYSAHVLLSISRLFLVYNLSVFLSESWFLSIHGSLSYGV